MADPERRAGTVLPLSHVFSSVTESYLPFYSNWWPHGHIIRSEPLFVYKLTHFLDPIVNQKNVAPYGWTFEDGYHAVCVCDAILESAAARKQVDVQY